MYLFAHDPLSTFFADFSSYESEYAVAHVEGASAGDPLVIPFKNRNLLFDFPSPLSLF